MKYLIADHLPEAARRAAATALYTAYVDRDGERITAAPRDVYGYCPLGLALAADGLTSKRCPSADQVLTALHLIPNDAHLWDVAFTFIADWDNGRITDLFEALGVERRGE